MAPIPSFLFRDHHLAGRPERGTAGRIVEEPVRGNQFCDLVTGNQGLSCFEIRFDRCHAREVVQRPSLYDLGV